VAGHKKGDGTIFVDRLDSKHMPQGAAKALKLMKLSELDRISSRLSSL
jgi:hypothetical protein